LSVPPIIEPPVFIQPGGLHGLAITVSCGLIARAAFTTGSKAGRLGAIEK
jgi:hypothetical protein